MQMQRYHSNDFLFLFKIQTFRNLRRKEKEKKRKERKKKK